MAVQHFNISYSKMNCNKKDSQILCFSESCEYDMLPARLFKVLITNYIQNDPFRESVTLGHRSTVHQTRGQHATTTQKAPKEGGNQTRGRPAVG